MDTELCNTGLVLGFGDAGFVHQSRSVKKEKSPVKFDLFPTYEKEETILKEKRADRLIFAKEDEDINRSSCEEHRQKPLKKIKLTKEQSTLLEQIFKERSILNTVQKQELAEKLNLKPRQVEVWFQNRRARTKLKKTEIDYEYLKSCYKNLIDENRRLRRELQEIKSMNLMNPSLIQISKSKMVICPLCQKLQAKKEA